MYAFTRSLMPLPELIVRWYADETTVANRLSTRDRINIASAEDTTLFNNFLDDWLANLQSDQVLELDVSEEDITYSKSVNTILKRI